MNGNRSYEAMDSVLKLGLEIKGGEERVPLSFDQNYTKYEPMYQPGRGFSRYSNALKNLIPFRCEERKATKTGIMPFDSVGLYSFVTFSWLSKLLHKAHHNGITMEEIPAVSPHDACSYNVDRLELLWEDELDRRGPQKASLFSVVLKFSRTRIFFSGLCYAASIAFGSLNSSLVTRNLLEYIQSGNGSYEEGVKWASMMIVTEFLRTVCYTWSYALSYRTALRVRSACFALLYKKIIRLNNSGDKRIGQTLMGEGNTKKCKVEPPTKWPVVGEIKFKNVNMAYGDDAPLILKDVSFTVNAGEKIGIVGRTGSGKSSLTVALFRLVELAQGKIEIDDVDISEISLEQLRTKLSIIPQDPTLFSGTVRSNLDPFKLHTDAEIWEALEKTKLKSRIQSISGHLDTSIGFGEDNLSVGERQLFCLTRALLRDTKILVLDEATAAVDPETEIAVQNMIQKEFSDRTVLTIAHRLETVLPLNRILVMNDGKILEFDTPSNLLSNETSEFSKMLAAAEKTTNHNE